MLSLKGYTISNWGQRPQYHIGSLTLPAWKAVPQSFIVLPSRQDRMRIAFDSEGVAPRLLKVLASSQVKTSKNRITKSDKPNESNSYIHQ